MNVKITRENLKPLGVAVLLIIAIYALGTVYLYFFKPSCPVTGVTDLFYSISPLPKPICYLSYGDVTLSFRTDLRDTDSVPVQPSEGDISATVGNIWVQNITVVYIPTGDDIKDKLYSVEVFEIVNKLKLAMLVNGDNDVGFDTKPISYFNTTDVNRLAGLIQHPLIVIIHPQFANQTIVYDTSNRVVVIEGTSEHNLDLAVEKFLLSALKLSYKS